MAEQRRVSIIVAGVFNSGLLCHPQPRQAVGAATQGAQMSVWARGATFDYFPTTAEWAYRAQALADVFGGLKDYNNCGLPAPDIFTFRMVKQAL